MYKLQNNSVLVLTAIKNDHRLNGWNNKHSFLPALEAGSPRLMHLQVWCLGRALFLVHRQQLSHCALTGVLSGVSFLRMLIPFVRAPPSRPQWPHCLTPSYWGLRFQAVGGGSWGTHMLSPNKYHVFSLWGSGLHPSECIWVSEQEVEVKVTMAVWVLQKQTWGRVWGPRVSGEPQPTHLGALWWGLATLSHPVLDPCLWPLYPHFLSLWKGSTLWRVENLTLSLMFVFLKGEQFHVV